MAADVPSVRMDVAPMEDFVHVREASHRVVAATLLAAFALAAGGTKEEF